MKTLLQLSLLFAFYSLQANEFPLLQPISVEKAPSQQIVPKKQLPVIKKVPKKKMYKTKTDTLVLKIEFETNSTKFKKNSTKAIEDFSASLLKDTASQVVIYAYTDSLQGEEKNLLLSQKRANKVVDVLHKLGIKSTRLTAIGMGEKDSISDNTTKEGQEKNSRIEALVIE